MRFIKPRQAWLGILMVVVVTLAAACAPMPGQEAVTPATMERAQSLNIAIPGRIVDPTNLNIYAPGVSRSDTGLHQMIYEYFFYQNLQTGEYVPWLAESYEYNDDYSAITVTLREGIRWSDGEPFTVDDVVFTYETLQANPGMTWAAEVIANVESVEAVNEREVQFNLLEANPRFHLNREAFPAVGIWGGITILPQHIWEGEDPLTFTNSDPIGTGAYVLTNATETAMTYTRNEDWWGGEVFGRMPEPQTVNFQYVGPETNVALALAADDLDIPSIGILSFGSFQEVTRRNQNVSAWYDEAPYAWLDPCPRAIMVQNDNEPWDQPELRWALSQLIDRESVVNLAYEGTTLPSWGVWPFYDGLQPYFDAIDDLLEEYDVMAYDPDAAAAAFEEAGYSLDAAGYFANGDGALSVSFVVNGDSSEEMRIAAVVADQLEAGGIQVEVQPLTGGVLSDNKLRGNYDLSLNAFCPGYIYENLELFHSKFYEPLGEQAPWFERNSFRYQNAEFDSIVDEMAVLPPEDEANIELYREAMEIWLADLPVIPLVQAPALVPFNERFWTGFPSAEDPWMMPVSWWATFTLLLNGYESPQTGEWADGIRSTVITAQSE